MRSPAQDRIIELLGLNPKKKGVLYIPELGIIFGNSKVGLVLSQLAYWDGKGTLYEDGWIIKTVDELYRETALTSTEQRSAIDLLIRYGVVRRARAGNPSKRALRLNMHMLEIIITSYQETGRLEDPNHYKQLLGAHTTYTKSSNTDYVSENNPKDMRGARAGGVNATGDSLADLFGYFDGKRSEDGDENVI